MGRDPTDNALVGRSWTLVPSDVEQGRGFGNLVVDNYQVVYHVHGEATPLIQCKRVLLACPIPVHGRHPALRVSNGVPRSLRRYKQLHCDWEGGWIL